MKISKIGSKAFTKWATVFGQSVTALPKDSNPIDTTSAESTMKSASVALEEGSKVSTQAVVLAQGNDTPTEDNKTQLGEGANKQIDTAIQASTKAEDVK